MSENIKVFTDGAYSSSRNIMGYAFVVVKEDIKINSWSSRINGGTNNRAEILACYYAISWCKLNEIFNFDIISDSMYVIGSMSKGWKRNLNLDLWEKLDNIIKNTTINWIHVKGHSGNKFNELCDYLATEASKISNKH